MSDSLPLLITLIWFGSYFIILFGSTFIIFLQWNRQFLHRNVIHHWISLNNALNVDQWDFDSSVLFGSFPPATRLHFFIRNISGIYLAVTNLLKFLSENNPQCVFWDNASWAKFVRILRRTHAKMNHCISINVSI